MEASRILRKPQNSGCRQAPEPYCHTLETLLNETSIWPAGAGAGILVRSEGTSPSFGRPPVAPTTPDQVRGDGSFPTNQPRISKMVVGAGLALPLGRSKQLPYVGCGASMYPMGNHNHQIVTLPISRFISESTCTSPPCGPDSTILWLSADSPGQGPVRDLYILLRTILWRRKVG